METSSSVDSGMQLRWGIRGCGDIASAFAQAMQGLPDSQHKVTAVCSSSLGRAQAFAADACAPYAPAVYDDEAAFLGNQHVDIVYVATLNTGHLSNVLAALQAGKHVLCEKPMGMSAEQVQTMQDEARQHNRFLMEGYWSRFFPVWQEMRTLLDSGALGKPVRLDANFDFQYIQYVNKFDASLGGGIVQSLGCYTYCLAQYLFRQAPSHIQAVGALLPNGVDHSMCVQLRYGDGVMASCRSSGAVSAPSGCTLLTQHGRLHVPDMMWCPTELQIWTRQAPADPKKTALSLQHTFSRPLPEQTFKCDFPNVTGFMYEMQAVRQAISNGSVECEEMSWEDSLQVARTTDEVLRQIRQA